MRLAPDVDFRLLARRTPGYVGADLTAISKVRSIRWVCGWLSLTSVAPPQEAAILAVKRAFAEVLSDARPGATDGVCFSACTLLAV